MTQSLPMIRRVVDSEGQIREHVLACAIRAQGMNRDDAILAMAR